MSEEPVTLTADGVHLEARWSRQPGSRGGVVLHPHPLYGGDMNNNVVLALIRALESRGISALRFNFRGVGRSEGKHGEGIAEQEDIKAACQFLSQQGINDIVVAGYSFGAWVACNAAAHLPITALAMVSPPVAMMSFDFSSLAIPFWVICGEHDPFCPREQLEKSLAKAPTLKELRWVANADHFYMGRTDQISAAAMEWFGPRSDT